MRVEPLEIQEPSISKDQAFDNLENGTATMALESGVSVIICCHNSAQRLPTTLEHLRNQKVEGFPWEVILVDNGSTDNTARFAEELWLSQEAPVALTIVSEPQLGLTFARRRGSQEARYDLLSFVDDDNWLAPDWVQSLFELMSSHPEVGACGGYSRAEFGGNCPEWFDDFCHLYAVNGQNCLQGDVTDRRALWGAGLTFRRSCLDQLETEFGFKSILCGRKGKRLSAGEDVEMCLALRLAGWKLWSEPRLSLVHFLPAPRLDWQYLRRLAYGSAFATPGHDALFFALKPARKGPLAVARRLRESWLWQTLSATAALMLHPVVLVRSLFSSGEGNQEIINTEFRKGRLMGLLASFAWYGQRRLEVGRMAKKMTAKCDLAASRASTSTL